MAISKEKKNTIIVSITNFLDSGCIIVSSLVLTAWSAAFGFDDNMKGLIGAVGANAFGSAVGALIGGFLADRFGRKFIYTYNLLLYASGIVVCMVAMLTYGTTAQFLGTPLIVAGVILTGISVGIGVPASWTYISEQSASDSRASNIGISQFAWSIGPVLINVLFMICALVIPMTFKDPSGAEQIYPLGTYGPFSGLLTAEILYAVLLVVALFAWWNQRKLEESRDWLEKRASGKQISLKDSFKSVLTNKVALKTMLFLIGIYLTWNIVAGTGGQFMPTFYKFANFDDATIGALNFLFVPLIILSLIFFAKFGDKISHRIIYAIGGILCILSFSAVCLFGWQLKQGNGENWAWLFFVYNILWALHGGISAQCFYALWSTELFPTKFRSGAQGIMFFMIRGLLGVWSLVALGPLGAATEQGFFGAALIMTGFLVISFLVGVIGCPNTRAKSLDQITAERYGDIE